MGCGCTTVGSQQILWHSHKLHQLLSLDQSLHHATLCIYTQSPGHRENLMPMERKAGRQQRSVYADIFFLSQYILLITDPCLGAKGNSIYTQIINAQPFHYKTQVEILSRLLSSQWLWYSLSSPFQYNAALFIFIHNALQRHFGFDDATFFCVAFHCISAFYHIKH